MKIRISLVTISLMFILFSSLVLATTVNTDYSGSGDFELTTKIESEVTPTITDRAEIHTGCEGVCCCCCQPDLSGEYYGYQIVMNNPYTASADEATVTYGCIELEQTIDDEYNGRRSETIYYTFFEGSGYATSFTYALDGQGLSYQLANGTGSSYISFTQVVYLDENFDYATSYGGAAWVCDPGWAGMVSEYSFGHYNADLGLYCYSVDETSHLNGFLHAQSTDSMDVLTKVKMGPSELIEHAGVEGAAQYDIVATAYNDFMSDFDFDLEMELW